MERLVGGPFACAVGADVRAARRAPTFAFSANAGGVFEPSVRTPNRYRLQAALSAGRRPTPLSNWRVRNTRGAHTR